MGKTILENLNIISINKTKSESNINLKIETNSEKKTKNQNSPNQKNILFNTNMINNYNKNYNLN